MDDSASDSNARPCPVKDCILPIDISLRSSDGVIFQTHTKNLEQYSEGFPQVGSVELNAEIPALEETADVLELMLKFMHHTRQPDLSEISFDLLSALAEAVEKYMIYSAMDICKVYMSLALEAHPIDVLVYSLKHDYIKLANKAAPLTLSEKSANVVCKAKAAHLHDSYLVTWFRYRDLYDDARRSVLRNPPAAGAGGLHKGGLGDCGLWEPYTREVLLATIETDLHDSRGIDSEEIMRSRSTSLASCTHCTRRADIWQRYAKTAFSTIPLFCDM